MIIRESRPGAGAVWALLLLRLACTASAQTVDLNPQEQIPGGVGDLISGDEDKPVLQRWTFWFGIALAAALLVVLAYFTWRGFRNYKRWKAERAAEEDRERAAAARAAAAGATPNPMLAVLDECACGMEVEELARRTGRRKQDLAHAPLGGAFIRSASAAV